MFGLIFSNSFFRTNFDEPYLEEIYHRPIKNEEKWFWHLIEINGTSLFQKITKDIFFYSKPMSNNIIQFCFLKHNKMLKSLHTMYQGRCGNLSGRGKEGPAIQFCSVCWMLLTHKVKTTTLVDWGTRFPQYLFFDDWNATEYNIIIFV